MKKIISLILLCALSLMCFSGCANTGDSGGNNNEPEAKKTVELQSGDALVSVLAEHLQSLNAFTDYISFTLEEKINFIKDGLQAVRADFNSSSRYFVCAYYADGHKGETENYCCAYKYTWVKFESAGDIPEKYKDLEFMAAFQIDNPATVTDLVSNDAKTPNVEHFTMYFPTFTDGINTAPALDFNKSSILLDYNDIETLYYTTTDESYKASTLDCINIDGRCYLTIYLYTIAEDNSYNETNTEIKLGEYRDALMSVMSDKVYGEIDSRGRTNCYGLIEINDFIDFLAE